MVPSPGSRRPARRQIPVPVEVAHGGPRPAAVAWAWGSSALNVAAARANWTVEPEREGTMETLELVGVVCVVVGILLVGVGYLFRHVGRNDGPTHGGGYESSPVDPPASE